ncbi:MAG: hypothetical protein WKF69_18205 [Daejeonella sp.]
MSGSKKDSKFSPNAFLIAGYFHHNKLIDREKGLRGMAESYLNVADAADPQNYALCEELGLSVIVSKGPHLTGNQWQKLSDGEIDEYIKKMVENGGKSKAIIGYFICDEPSSLAFPALAKAVAAVKKYAPGKIAYINLYPNYATLWQMDQVKSQLGTKTYTEYLEKFVNEVKPQIISYDNYMVQFSKDLQNKAQSAKYYTNLMEVYRVALKYNIPFFNIVSSNQIRHYTTIPSPQNLAFQAYTSLAAGVGGIIWYTYHGQAYDYNPLDTNEKRTLIWQYLKEVNRQVSILGPIIKKLKSTGVYFSDATIDPSLPLLPGQHLQSVDSEEPLMVGEFISEKGTKYIMVVNLSLEKSARFVLHTKIPDERLFVVSVGEDVPYLSEILNHKNLKGSMRGNSMEQIEMSKQNASWLPAGQGVLIKCGGSN